MTVATTCSVAARRPPISSGSPSGISTFAEDLPLGHAHRARRVDGRAVDRLDAGVGAREYRRDRQDHERDDAAIGLLDHADQEQISRRMSPKDGRARAAPRCRRRSRGPCRCGRCRYPTGMAIADGDQHGDHV